MNLLRQVTYKVVAKQSSFLITYITISAFWYLSLFPGRLGFDYSKAIVMIQNGESTNWWTSSFWWFLRISSADGETIAISSSICLAALGFSLYYLSEAMPGNKNLNRISLLIVSLTPLYGAFGVNVSHDVFQAAGILTFTGFQIKFLVSNLSLAKIDFFAVMLASVMVLTTHYGLPLILINLVLFISKRYFKLAVLVGGTTVLISVLAPIGITQVPTHGLVLPIVADLKCIAQLPTADLSRDDWNFLLSIAPEDEWKEPKTCSFIDYSLEDMKSLKLDEIKLTRELTFNYLKIASHNPAVVAMAHFQRASVALPPPFFFGPPNQVTKNPDIPIGQGTNNALQSYPGVLHPSIDESSVSTEIKWVAPLEVIAQAGIFIVNQASWFWGWGGLWLWPTTLFLIIQFKGVGVINRLNVFANILVLHGLLLILAAPLPRYVISTILLGLYISIKSILSGYQRVPRSH